MGFELEPFGPSTLLLEGHAGGFRRRGRREAAVGHARQHGRERFSRVGRGRARGMAQAARLSWLGAGRARARGAGDSRAARRSRSHRSSRPTARTGARSISTSRAGRSSGCFADEFTAQKSSIAKSPAEGTRESDQSWLHRRPDRFGQERDRDGQSRSASAPKSSTRIRANSISGWISARRSRRAEERRRVPHHLIDVRTPDQPLDVAEFVAMARACDRRHRAPRPARRSWWAAAGSICARCAAGSSRARRRRRRSAASSNRSPRERGIPFLHDELMKIDPPSASRIQRNDLYRIVRALEVHRITGIPITVHQERHRFAEREFDTLTIALEVPRKQLYEAINARFDSMIAAGFVDEVRRLIGAGLQSRASAA